MSYPSSPRDPLVESLNPLVVRGTLRPEQANEVYRAVSSAAAGGGESSDETSGPGWERPRLLAGVSVLGATLLLAALSIASANSEQSVSQVVNGTSVDESFLGKQFALMLLITLFLAAAAAASHVLLTGRPYVRLISSVSAAFTLLALVTTVGSTWDAEALIYLGGIVLLVGGLAGYWFLKGQVLVPVAVAGGALFLGQLLSPLTTRSSSRGPPCWQGWCSSATASWSQSRGGDSRAGTWPRCSVAGSRSPRCGSLSSPSGSPLSSSASRLLRHRTTRAPTCGSPWCSVS